LLNYLWELSYELSVSSLLCSFFWIIFMSSLMNSLCELSFVFVSVFWIIYVSSLRNSLCEFSFVFGIIFGSSLMNSLCEFSLVFVFLLIIFVSYLMNYRCGFSLVFVCFSKNMCELSLVLLLCLFFRIICVGSLMD